MVKFSSAPIHVLDAGAVWTDKTTRNSSSRGSQIAKYQGKVVPFHEEKQCGGFSCLQNNMQSDELPWCMYSSASQKFSSTILPHNIFFWQEHDGGNSLRPWKHDVCCFVTASRIKCGWCITRGVSAGLHKNTFQRLIQVQASVQLDVCWVSGLNW